MLKKIFLSILALLGFGVLPAAAYWTAYRYTGVYFRAKLIPLPFERFGVAFGLGSCLWVLAIAFFVTAIFSKNKRRVG